MPPRKPLPDTIPTDVVIHDYPVGVGRDGRFILLCVPPVESIYMHQLPQLYDNQQAEKENRRVARQLRKQEQTEVQVATQEIDGRKVHMWDGSKFIPVAVRGQHGTTKELLVTTVSGEKMAVSYYSRTYLLTDEEAIQLEQAYARREALRTEINQIQRAHEVGENRYTVEIEGFPPVAVVRHWTPTNGYTHYDKQPVQVLPGGRLGVTTHHGEMTEGCDTRDLSMRLMAKYHPSRGVPIVTVDTGKWDNDPVIAGPVPFSGYPTDHYPDRDGCKGYPHIYKATLPVDEIREKELEHKTILEEITTLESHPYTWRG